VTLTFFCQRTITLAVKPTRLSRGWNVIFVSWKGSGNMKIYSPTGIIIPSGVAFREYDTLG
jgi:hypothetical protein